ncbi:hypothetical protein SK128_023460 [Halocaridina rubra]|uniref:Cytochrome P450 n=1 Tax=Halocaridina rubra TaxID=373956 RepID=A0AAN8XDB4_HALRR
MARIVSEWVPPVTCGNHWLRYLGTSSRYSGNFSRLIQNEETATILEEKQQNQPCYDTLVKPVSEIPGPKSYPFFGSILSIIFSKDYDKKSAHTIFISLVKKFGDIVCLKSPTYPPCVVLNKPDDVQTVVQNTMQNPIRLGFFALDRVRKDAVDYFENKGGILVENNEEWKRVRSRVQTPMMKIKNVAAFLPKVDQVTLDFMDRIASLQEKHGEMPDDFQTELYKWALEWHKSMLTICQVIVFDSELYHHPSNNSFKYFNYSVSLVALNRRIGCLEPDLSSNSEPMKLIYNVNKIFDALNETEHGLQFWRIYPTAAYKQLQISHSEFLRIADQNINQTEAALLSKNSKIGDDELMLMEKLLLTPGLSRKDVVTLILDMLFAGIDTTSHTLGFTLYLLAKNPKCQAKLQREVDEVLGDMKGLLTLKHLSQLSYLKAVVKESLSGFIFYVHEQYAALLMGLTMGHDERNFPRPKEFLPERWLRNKPLGSIHPYSTFPFGVGTRMCIGRRIAEQELYIFLARIMQRFTVEYNYQDIDIKSRLVFVPSQPLRFKFTERRN